MMKRTWVQIAVLVLVVTLLMAAWTSAVLAQETTKQVGLVVRYGDGTVHQEVVRVPAQSKTLDVLKSSIAQHHDGGLRRRLHRSMQDRWGWLAPPTTASVLPRHGPSGY